MIKKDFILVFSTIILATFQSPYAIADDINIGKIWRPESLPQVPKDGIDEDEWDRIVSSFTHKGNDQQSLLLLSLANGEKATAVLKSYIKEHIGRKLPRNSDWGVSIYSLGLVKSDEAKDYLLELWQYYDEGIANDKIVLKPSDIESNMWPLAPIEDAIEFYYSDKEIQKWMKERVKESETIPDTFTGIYRKTVRQHFLSCEYRIEIVENAHGDMSRAAEKVTEYITTLPTLKGNETEEEWIKKRNFKDYRLEDILYRLGKQLSLAIWSKYLKDGTEIKSELKCRLSLLAIFNYLREIEETCMFEISDEDKPFIEDMVKYYLSLPKGHPKQLGISGLYKMWLYNPKEEGSYAKLKEISELLDNSRRNTIKYWVERNKAKNKK